jgi:hypothetical protein
VGRTRPYDKRPKLSPAAPSQLQGSAESCKVGPKDSYSRDGVMRGALCPTSTRRRVGIVASKGWSGWVAVAAGLGWDIAWVAVEDSQLGQAWRRDLATQAI